MMVTPPLSIRIHPGIPAQFPTGGLPALPEDWQVQELRFGQVYHRDVVNVGQPAISGLPQAEALPRTRDL